MKTWPEFKKTGLLELVCEDPYEQKYWTAIFDQMYEDPHVLDTWDYQWLYACWAQHGLAIAPNRNLISNLGFNRADAAHTTGDSPRARLATTDIWEVSHPPFVVKDGDADNYTFNYIFGGKEMKEQDTLRGRIRAVKKRMNLRTRLSSLKQKFVP
jgi:hypothetical protein